MSVFSNFLPKKVQFILQVFHSHDFPTYLVGGTLRDLLLGLVPTDVDLATAATPDEIKLLFPNHFSTGEKYGTMTIVHEDLQVEVTTFRKDHAYVGHRHPQGVTFSQDILQDLARRDFTVNAMAWDGDELLDPFDGQVDLQNRCLRTVRDPKERFQEDALRILRGLRFSSTLGFSLEPATLSAMQLCAPLVEKLSGERIWSELKKILQGPSPDDIGQLQALSLLPALTPRESISFSPFSVEERPAVYLSQLMQSPAAACLALSTKEKKAFSLWPLRQALGAAPSSVELKRLLSHHGLEAVDLALRISLAQGALSPATSPLLAGILERGEPYLPSHLSVTGADLLHLGVPTGPAVGHLLRQLLEAVWKDPCKNEKRTLLKMVADHHKEWHI